MTNSHTREPELEKMDTSAHAQKFALHSLSSQEKLLLIELQKTRAQIVNELNKIDPAACGSDDNWFSVKDTIEGYEQKMKDASKPYVKSTPSKKSKAGARRHLKPLPASTVGGMIIPPAGGGGPLRLTTFKTGVDMLPIMASTGDAALEVGLKTQGKLQLPVFKLPSLDTTQYKKKVVNGTIVHVKLRPKSGSRPTSLHVSNRGVVYRDRQEFLRAVAVMHMRMQPDERAYVQWHLRMTEKNVSEVGQDIQLDLLMQEQEREDADLARRRGLMDGQDGGSAADAMDVAIAPPTGLRQPLSLFMHVVYLDNTQRRAVASDAPSSSSAHPVYSPDSYDEQPPTRPRHSAPNSVPGSPVDLQGQPALMVRQMRSMPHMARSSSQGGDELDDEGSASVYTSHSRGAHQAAAGLVHGLANSMYGGGKAPTRHGHGHGNGHGHGHGVSADLSAILSSPGGKKPPHHTLSSPTPHAPRSVASTSVKSIRDASSIREAYGTTRRTKKRLLGSKGSITAWGTEASVGNSEQTAASNAASASQALKMELVRSLQTMQHHTERVKDDILRIQHVVDISNPKAKSFMFAMAAERMVTAVHACVVKELRRGMHAWKLAVRQEERKAMVDVYVRFHGLRYLAQSLKWLVHTAMVKKWVKWVAYAQYETARLRAIVENRAATVIQKRARGMVARMRVAQLRKLKKYEHLYTACIDIQRMFRGKPVRWRYQAWKRSEKRRKMATKIQSQWRRCLAAKRVRALRFSLDKAYAATVINSLVRMYNAKVRVARMRLDRLHHYSAVQIQRVVRGFLGRRRVAQLLQDLEEFYAAQLIQTRIRMFLARRFLVRKRIDTHAYWAMRARAAVMIQKTYRGFRGRLKARVFTMEITRKRRRTHQAATRITNMCRGFVARRKLIRLKAERTTRWIAQARAWKEMWSEDAQDWFYYAEDSQDSVWEPKKEGYTKADGRLVLEDGSIIVDPDVAAALDMEMMRLPKDLCSECNERYAIRACQECEDSYCTPCYKNAHATGTRKKHTFTAVGPVDCGECENLLAERWCVTCDEAHCDHCWRKLHSKGKRRFHPFCKVWPGGKVGKQMMTMDGEELTDMSYDPTFLMRRYEQEEAAQAPATEFNYSYPAGEAYDDTPQLQTQPQSQLELEYPPDGTGWLQQQQQQQQDASLALTTGADEGTWETAYDEEGNVYYYNTLSGVSQYEDPFAQDPEAQHMKGLLEQWAQAYDEEGNVYWYNSTNGASQYENPFAAYNSEKGGAEGGWGEGQEGYEGSAL